MPGFNVNNFRSQGLIQGGARPTQFAVMLTFPQSLDVGVAQQKAPFLCTASELPASLIEPVEVSYFGRKIKLNGDRIFQDWRVTILNDEDFILRNAFEKWHNAINAIISNTLDPNLTSINPDSGQSYKVNSTITQFKKIGPGEFDGDGAIKTYKMDGMFPISIDSIPVSWDDSNMIERFDVTFTYDWWEPQVRGNDIPQFEIEPI